MNSRFSLRRFLGTAAAPPIARAAALMRPLVPGRADYDDRMRAELRNYQTVENVHDLPKIYNVWSAKYVAPKVRAVFGVAGIEEFYARYALQYAAERPDEVVDITSLGAGNGDFEVGIAGLLKANGLDRFRFQCLDINPAMLGRGREIAAKAGLAANFEFIEADASQWTSAAPVGMVMAHHSLHHFERLELTFDSVKRAIGENGYFVSADMIGRNGHMRWPEALAVIDDIWRTMPDRYKYNHLLKRFEKHYENWDCSTESFEGIRAQDILPLLVQRFHFDAFVGFGNLPDLFVDRCFGHNLDPNNAEDVAFIDRVGELNERLIDDGTIKPTQMLAVMRAGGSGPCRCHKHWTPQFCVRRTEGQP